MSLHVVRLPDVGEGVAEAELVAWLVAVGDPVTPESSLAEVLTDKATIEIACPVTGVVASLHGEPGDTLAVGGDLVVVEIAEHAAAVAHDARDVPTSPTDPTGPTDRRADVAVAPPAPERPMATPLVRRRAQELGVDLGGVVGSGPGGRVLQADLDRAAPPAPARVASDTPRTEPVLGLRRRIAERMSKAWTEIPHITYVEAVDATELQALRGILNERASSATSRLTLLPFVIRALVIASREHPHCNATFDQDAGTLSVYDAVHVGVATQTPDGLKVPVLRHAESSTLREMAEEISRVAEAAREGHATREELTGSTITVTSLGALGGLVTTPIINQPEVAVIGVNKLEVRPVWRDGTVVPREMFNLSSSFDHRIIDGWEAATFVQRVRELLEHPALLFAGHDI